MDAQELDIKVIELYLDSTKTFFQLASSSLALSYLVTGKLMKKPPSVGERRLLVAAWIALVVTILNASFYQYLGVKYLEFRHNPGGYVFPLPEFLLQRPGIPYILMLVSFFVGVICLSIFAGRTVIQWKIEPEKPRKT